MLKGLLLAAAVQAEWRGLGVQQSRGWVHYAIHRPEPHIMLFRQVHCLLLNSSVLLSACAVIPHFPLWRLAWPAHVVKRGLLALLMRRRPKGYGLPQPGQALVQNGQEVQVQ